MSFAQINADLDVVLIQTNEEWIKLERHSDDLRISKNIEVFTDKVEGLLNISIAAPNPPIKRVVLRWRHSIEKKVKILGDHWERGYGDLEWRGIIPERVS